MTAMTRIARVIAAAAIGAALAMAAPTVGATIHALGPAPIAGHAMPAYATCAEEDGSTDGQPFPCMWDATVQGNGRGDSYVLIAPACSPGLMSLPCDDLEAITGEPR